MGNYKKMNVWIESMDVVTDIYKLTKGREFKKDFGLKDQIQRSAVSIPSNIAEGEESLTQKMAIKHFSIAKASSAELITQLIIADNIEYVKSEDRRILEDKISKIAASLKNLIKYR